MCQHFCLPCILPSKKKKNGKTVFGAQLLMDANTKLEFHLQRPAAAVLYTKKKFGKGEQKLGGVGKNEGN